MRCITNDNNNDANVENDIVIVIAFITIIITIIIIIIANIIIISDCIHGICTLILREPSSPRLENKFLTTIMIFVYKPRFMYI